MPTGYVKKLAKQHGKSTKAAENTWKKAKKAAMKAGHAEEYDYVTGVFKKMMGESGSYPSFTQFLLIENDLDNLEFDVDAGDMGSIGVPGPTAADTGAMDAAPFGDEDEFDPEGDLEMGKPVEVDLDTDERFLALPGREKMRIRKLAQELSGYELDDELTQAFEKSVGGSSFFTRDMEDDMGEPEMEKPMRDPNAPRQRAKSGATHAYKIRRGLPQ